MGLVPHSAYLRLWLCLTLQAEYFQACTRHASELRNRALEGGLSPGEEQHGKTTPPASAQAHCSCLHPARAYTLHGPCSGLPLARARVAVRDRLLCAASQSLLAALAPPRTWPSLLSWSVQRWQQLRRMEAM